MEGVKAAFRQAAALAAGKAITLFARFVTAPRALWQGIEPTHAQRVYFANHSSNGDFVLIWTVLPKRLRARTRPVAAADYWLTSRLRSFIGREVFDAVGFLPFLSAAEKTRKAREKLLAWRIQRPDVALMHGLFRFVLRRVK